MNLLTLRWAAIYSDLTKIMKTIKSWKVNLRCVRGHLRTVAVNFARLATFSFTGGEARRIWAACTDSRLAWANRFVQRKAYRIDFPLAHPSPNRKMKRRKAGERLKIILKRKRKIAKLKWLIVFLDPYHPLQRFFRRERNVLNRARHPHWATPVSGSR